MNATADRRVEVPTRLVIRDGAAVVLVLTLLNLAVYGTARALGASMRLDPLGQEPNHFIPWFDVVWKTALPLALGVTILWMVRRSRPGVTILLIAVLVIFVPSSAVPAGVAHEGLTGAALLLLHLLPTAGFTVLVLRVRANQPVSSPRAERRVST